MKLTEQQEQLLSFVKIKHGDQIRKYTGEPYYNHLISVAEIVSSKVSNCTEIALCHDLFEDTDCTFSELHNTLVNIGYDRHEAYDICTCVKELTDVYTKESYPYLNRQKRKENEALRLSRVSYRSQTVKYADLIDNTTSIIEHDENFAKVYLKEKKRILELMTRGNQELRQKCINALTSSTSQERQ